MKIWIKDLIPLGQNINLNNCILDDKSLRIIKVLGNEIMEDLNKIDENKRTDLFRDFCNIHYLKKNWYSNPNTVNELLQSQEIVSEDVVNNHLKLIKRIDKKYKENR